MFVAVVEANTFEVLTGRTVPVGTEAKDAVIPLPRCSISTVPPTPIYKALYWLGLSLLVLTAVKMLYVCADIRESPVVLPYIYTDWGHIKLLRTIDFHSFFVVSICVVDVLLPSKIVADVVQLCLVFMFRLPQLSSDAL